MLLSFVFILRGQRLVSLNGARNLVEDKNPGTYVARLACSTRER